MNKKKFENYDLRNFISYYFSQLILFLQTNKKKRNTEIQKSCIAKWRKKHVYIVIMDLI